MTIVRMERPAVEFWSTTDFTRWYMDRYREMKNSWDLEFPDRAWAMYGTHIKRFMKKFKLSNTEYRAFIDWVFSEDFLCGRRDITFLCIVNPDVYLLFVRLRKRGSLHAVHSMTVEEEQALRERIRTSKSLFSEDR